MKGKTRKVGVGEVGRWDGMGRRDWKVTYQVAIDRQL